MPVFVLVVYLVASPAGEAEPADVASADEPGSPAASAAGKRPLDALLDNQRGWVVIRRLTDLLHVHGKLWSVGSVRLTCRRWSDS